MLPPVPVPEPPLPVLPPVGEVPPDPLPPFPVVPPVPVPEPPLPVLPPVLWPMQVPLTHESPKGQALPQLPQLPVLEAVSTQVPLQFCWPATEQPQAPLLQVAPTGQTVQLVPQCPESVFELHAPSVHIMLPEPQPADEHCPLSQTWPLEQAMQVDPQWSVLEATHIPLQEKNPCAQTHAPAWHICPVSHV